jgi:hypothetical protein
MGSSSSSANFFIICNEFHYNLHKKPQFNIERDSTLTQTNLLKLIDCTDDLTEFETNLVFNWLDRNSNESRILNELTQINTNVVFLTITEAQINISFL